MREFPPNCYYCELSGFVSVDQYERHVVQKHHGVPGYPGPADLRALNLKAQGMYWERVIKQNEYSKYFRGMMK